MTSNDPTQEWEGVAKLNMGNHRLAQTAALISGPVVKDELAFRLSVDHQQRETAVDLPHYDPVGTRVGLKPLTPAQNYSGRRLRCLISIAV